MRLRFLWIGKTRDPLLAEVEEIYCTRIARFASVKKTTVRDLKKADPRQRAARLQEEARRIKRKLSPQTYLIVLDSGGREFTSEQFASFISRQMNQSLEEMTFLAGGHMGVSARIKERANLVLSLSRLTFPHELTRVVLLEQVYRAFTIMKGLPYHK